MDPKLTKRDPDTNTWHEYNPSTNSWDNTKRPIEPGHSYVVGPYGNYKRGGGRKSRRNARSRRNSKKSKRVRHTRRKQTRRHRHRR